MSECSAVVRLQVVHPVPAFFIFQIFQIFSKKVLTAYNSGAIIHLVVSEMTKT